MALLDDEMSRLRERLQRLEEERASLAGHYERLKAILSPLRRMPAELLGEIFSWTLPPDAEALRRGGRLKLKDSPLVLTWTSSRWRAVAVSTPSLWTLVYINYPDHAPPLSAVETQIQRAGPLKIHFFPSDETSDFRPQLEMFQLLAKHSLGWEELHLGVIHAMLPLLSTLRNRVPILRRISLRWQDLHPLESVDCFLLYLIEFFSKHAYVTPTLPPHQIPFPAHQLTRYSADGPLQAHMHILQAAKNLTEAWIFVFPGNTTARFETQNLPSLTRLGSSDGEILDYLRLPALQEISLSAHKSFVGGQDILVRLQSLLDRSSSPLRSLCLDGSFIPRAATPFLHACTSITELRILTGPYPVFSPWLLELSRPGSTMVAPHIRSIVFGCRIRDLDSEYLRMLKSRWKAPGSELVAASLLIPGVKGPPDAASLSALDALRQDGLDVLLLYGQEAADALSPWNVGIY
ncbi:hypothetical protein DFH07DRAFT_829073 [Mycena maculata]|uniref:F-box domain-containing protein n=1 Tax=Mycena maculata TaxID=230809 RepID=A0AAD7IUB3_9AGAR|nr:hypothetical protein DFH07DRAFT_829073 [Mycena maculata]